MDEQPETPAAEPPPPGLIAMDEQPETSMDEQPETPAAEPLPSASSSRRSATSSRRRSPARDTPMLIHEVYAKMVEGLAKNGIIPDESDKDYHTPIPHTTTHVDRRLRPS